MQWQNEYGGYSEFLDLLYDIHTYIHISRDIISHLKYSGENLNFITLNIKKDLVYAINYYIFVFIPHDFLMAGVSRFSLLKRIHEIFNIQSV